MNKFELDKLTFKDICNKYINGEIYVNKVIDQDTVDTNGYQRDEAWTETKERNLISSVISSDPIPSIILWTTPKTNGIKEKTEWEIIDGQQRLNSFKKFFEGELELEKKYKDFFKTEPFVIDNLKKEYENQLAEYKVSTIIMKHLDIKDAINVFINMNKNPKALNNHEIREADNIDLKNNKLFVNSFLLKEEVDLLKNTKISNNPAGSKKSNIREFLFKLFLFYNKGYKFQKDDKKTLDSSYKNEIIEKNFNSFKIELTNFLKDLSKVYSLETTKSFNTKMYIQIYYKLWKQQDNFIDKFTKFQKFINERTTDGNSLPIDKNKAEKDDFRMNSSIQDRQKKNSYKILLKILSKTK